MIITSFHCSFGEFEERGSDSFEMGGENIKQKPTRGAHVLVLPYPLQGHINPMLQFSKRLASKGLQVTFLTTTSMPSQPMPSSHLNLEFVRISDGFLEGGNRAETNANLDQFIANVSQSLLELIDLYRQMRLEPIPKMVIYDSLMPWVLDVARKSRVEGATFFTQSCVVNYIYYHFYKGELKSPVEGCLVSLPFVKGLLRACDLPSFVSCPSTYPHLVRLLMSQFSNLDEADLLLVNTADKLEIEVLKWMSNQWPTKAIGPTIPSIYLDKRLPDDKDYNLSLFKPETDACIPWLDAKETDSVVYVSMGSMVSLGQEQMEELAMGLEKCNRHFLWVVRSSEENKLPSNFKHRTSKKGLIVNWCLQLEVLAHRAVGCFVTHCGWNSTLEAISLGVPMVAFPQWTDQPTNAKCIADFWRVGVRVKRNENGVVTREEMEDCIRRVTEGEKGKEIKMNASKLKEEAKGAMEKGGSSDKNIEELVAKLSGLSLVNEENM